MADSDSDRPTEDTGPDWAAYYRHTLGREPRPLFLRGMAAVQAAGAHPGRAVEIGFGDGTETLALLEAGWRVLAIDSTREAETLLRERVPESVAAQLEIVTAPAQAIEIPPFDLLYAGYALSFVPPPAFWRLWRLIGRAVRPGGFLIVNVFGVNDSWHDDPEMTFLNRTAVSQLLADLEVLALDETDEDGDSFAGPKHWHIFDIVARSPLGARRAGVTR